MMPCKTGAQCVEECVKAGAGYILIPGDKAHPFCAKKNLISPYAGEKVQIEGDLQGNTIAVTAIK